jgi:uncharacterized protein YkwD
VIWFDILIVLAVLVAMARGYHRGLILIVLDLLGLALAVVVAMTFYKSASPLTASLTSIPSVGQALAFGLIYLLVQSIYSLTMARILQSREWPVMQAKWNHWLGSVANGIKMLVIIGLVLIVFSGLPLASSQKSPVTDARIPQALLSASSGLQQAINQRIGNQLATALNFLTVRQENHEHIELGFKTNRGKVDAAAEEAMLVLINKERTSRGLGALTMNPKAREVARAYSQNMLVHGYFSHTDQNGHDPFWRMEQGGVEFFAAGENLALAPTLIQAHVGLMNSPGHRANILSPDFGTVGIGIINAGPYGLMVTQNFTN